MAYITRVTTKWADTTLPIDQQLAKVRDLYMTDFVADGFSPAAVTALRREAISNGDLLARGVVISSDGTQIITTVIWRSEDAQNTYIEHPVMLAYIEAMEKGGWSVTAAPVAPRA